MHEPLFPTLFHDTLQSCILDHKNISRLREELHIADQLTILDLILKQNTELVFVNMCIRGLVEGQELDQTALGDDDEEVAVKLTELDASDGGTVENRDGADAVMNIGGLECREL